MSTTPWTEATDATSTGTVAGTGTGSATGTLVSGWPVPVLADDGREPLTDLLVPVHPAVWNDRAATTAAALATRWHLPIRLVQVPIEHGSEPDDPEWTESEWTESAIRWAQAILAGRPEVETATTLASAAQPGSLVVMGCRPDDDWTAAVPRAIGELLQSLPGPVMFCGPHATPGFPTRFATTGVAGTMGEISTSLLVPVDTSPEAETTLDPAVELARSMAATVWLVRVVDDATAAAIAQRRASGHQASESAYVRSKAAELEAKGVAAGWEVLRVADATEVGPALVDFAASREVSLIVAPTHGTVSRSLIASSTAPVLLA